MSPADWSRPFEEPIPLPGRDPLTTLRQAGEYIAALPARNQQQVHWQIAAEMLLLAAEGVRPVMFARIAILRALHHGQPPSPPAPRKKPAKKYRVIG